MIMTSFISVKHASSINYWPVFYAYWPYYWSVFYAFSLNNPLKIRVNTQSSKNNQSLMGERGI